MTPAVTLDMSKAQPLGSAAPVTLDMSKATPLSGQPEQTGSNATVTVPDAGRIPGVMSFGHKVTPEQAAGGVAVGAVAGAAPLVAASGMVPPVARALAPIVKRYGIKALEGAGLGLGYDLYKELKKVFEGE